MKIIEIDKNHKHWQALVELALAINPKNRIWLLNQPVHMISDHVFAAIINDKVVGYYRFVCLPMGKHKDKPLIKYDGKQLIEAEGKTQGTREGYRNRGIARAMQEEMIKQAKKRGCYQLRSESPYNETIIRLKISLGFGIQLNYRSYSVYFVKAL